MNYKKISAILFAKQEPMKVELANAFTTSLKEAQALTKQMTGIIDNAEKRGNTFYNAAKALIALDGTAAPVFAKAKQAMSVHEKALADARVAMKQLGVDESAIPDMKAAIDAFATLSSEMSSAESDLGFIVDEAKKIIR